MNYDSISEAIIENTKINPNKLCIVDDQRDYSYREFLNYIIQIAKQIDEYKERTIVVQCNQDASFLALNFACELTNNIFVPLEKDASLDRINDIIVETNPVYIFSNKKLEIIDYEIKPIPVYEEKEYEVDFAMPEANRTSQILFTTGTTGKSKGVELSNINNIALAENIINGSKMKKNNIELIVLPISHSHALRSSYANLVAGNTIVLVDGVMMIKKIFVLIDKYNINSLDFSPSAIKMLIKLAKSKLLALKDRIDYIEFGTAVLDEETKEILIEKFPNTRLYNFYGSTESGRSCVIDFNMENRKRCIGKPTINAQFIVTDEDRNEIISSEENPGLLACKGKMNMVGYWNQPELTAKTLKNGYLYTNDLAYIDDAGYVYIYGRNGNVINFGGIKISPEEIEEQIAKYQEIIDCACVPKKDEIYGQVPYLYVQVRNKETFDKKILLDFAKNHIDSNKIPKQIEIIDQIPRTFNGKIKRDELIKLCNS